MKLEVGKAYRRGNGAIETVAGLTRHDREWVWTIQGNWYRQSDGRWIDYSPESGHAPMSVPTFRDLIEEADENKKLDDEKP